jgi:PhnB protein
MAVKSKPDGYHSVTPYLIVRGGAKAIEFYRNAFGADELFRMESPGGGIGHAELQIGDSRVMLADEHPEVGAKSPASVGGSAVHLMIYVDDCDAVFNRAIAAGATETRPLRDEFYGDRTGNLVDPFGHCWTIATHKEDVPPEELERRAEAYAKENAGA